MANRSKMQVYKEDKASNLLITFEFRNGSSLIIVSQRVEGITPEMYDWYQQDMPNHLPKYQKMITMKELERQANGALVLHQRIITPTFSFSSNRSLILSFFDEKRTDGSMLFVGGSKGSEALV